MFSSNASVSLMVCWMYTQLLLKGSQFLLTVLYLKASFHCPYQVKSSWKLFLFHIFFSVFLRNIHSENARIGRRKSYTCSYFMCLQFYSRSPLNATFTSTLQWFVLTSISSGSCREWKERTNGLWKSLWFPYIHNYHYDLMFWVEILNNWEHVK